MSWQHWALLLFFLMGLTGGFLGMDKPREPRDIKDAGAGLLFSVVMIMLLVWGQR